jgi:hypothetical protein
MWLRSPNSVGATPKPGLWIRSWKELRKQSTFASRSKVRLFRLTENIKVSCGRSGGRFFTKRALRRFLNKTKLMNLLTFESFLVTYSHLAL